MPSFLHPFFTVSLTSFLKKSYLTGMPMSINQAGKKTENPKDLPGRQTKLNYVSNTFAFEWILVEIFGSIKILSITST